jgi:ethanolamine utilization protein EutA
MFARLRLQRLADSLSSRYVVVERTVLHRSPIVLTPYTAGDAIDAATLEAEIASWYSAAGLTRAEVDTGAVILTGTALLAGNARELANLFSDEGGAFVCATAGHALEAALAAHGSGSVGRSRRDHETILHVDIGGGTTKLARIEDGAIVATTAIAVGARSRHAGRDPDERRRIASELADWIVAATRGAAVPLGLQLLPPLPRANAPARITLSGGVSEYASGRERMDHDDLGRELAAAVLALRATLPAPLEIASDGIRATVIGASQFTVQVSGSTIGIGAPLPLRNVPVVRLGGDVRGSGPIAVAVKWEGEPEHARVRALAERIASATDRRPLIVASDGDIAATLAAVLRDELHFRGDLITLDGLDLGDLDYIDVGAPQPPSGVVPVIVKSLVFQEKR